MEGLKLSAKASEGSQKLQTTGTNVGALPVSVNAPTKPVGGLKGQLGLWISRDGVVSSDRARGTSKGGRKSRKADRVTGVTPVGVNTQERSVEG